MTLDSIIAQTAEPDVTANRLQDLLQQSEAASVFDSFDESERTALVRIIGISRFLYHFLVRNPDALSDIGKSYQCVSSLSMDDATALRRYKYRSLLQIAWMDLAQSEDYAAVLFALSHLADTVLSNCNRMVASDSELFPADVEKDLAMIGLGKLGANELNFSSDVDIVFVTRNADVKTRHDIHAHYTKHIRALCRLLEENTEHGFLYRVDLNLRPWGRSAPLVFSIEENETYYQASKEAWERIAWLRGRYITGASKVGAEMLENMRPFVFHKTLSADEVERLLRIKTDMTQQRAKAGHWNVKLGQGGIRDIEFFVHILQLLNGASKPGLQITNTLLLIKQLQELGLISTSEAQELTGSYLFLRRLENRLQMVDEQQTHQLPQDKDRLTKVARHMGYQAESDDEVLAGFNDDLLLNQQVACKYFDRLFSDREVFQ